MFIMGLCVNRATGFAAYDCQNRSNHMEVYSLLEPASCHATSTDLLVERALPAEIIQIKKTRNIPVMRCLVIVTEVSQYCGHSSAAGPMRFHKFRETANLEPQACREASGNKGKIEVGGKIYPAVIGTTTSHTNYLAGGLDDSGNCEVGQYQDMRTKKTYGYHVASRVLEIMEDMSMMCKIVSS